MAHCPCRVSQTKPTPIRSKDFLGFNSEVLKLWLGALNLPVMDSKGQLLNCLKRALLGNSGKSHSNTTANSKQQKWMSGRLHIKAWPSWSTKKNTIDWYSTGETETFPPQQNSAVIASHKQEQEDNALKGHSFCIGAASVAIGQARQISLSKFWVVGCQIVTSFILELLNIH